MARKAYKLLRLRKDGSLGPLFINRRQRLSVGVEYRAEDHRTKGYAHRPGWHSLCAPEAPHLSKKGRVWCEVEVEGWTEHQRPAAQGGVWLLSETLKITGVVK